MRNRIKRNAKKHCRETAELASGRRITVDFFEEGERGEHVDEAEAAPAARGLGERGGQHHHHRGDVLEEEPPQVAPERIHRAKTLADRAGPVRAAGDANCEMRERGRGRELSLRGGRHSLYGVPDGGEGGGGSPERSAATARR